MNKRENVRAAVDLACLGLSSADHSQSGSLVYSAQSAPELPSSTVAAASAAAARPGLGMPATSLASLAHVPAQGAVAIAMASPLAAATATGQQEEEAVSELQTQDSQTEPLRRSARVLVSQPSSYTQAEATQAALSTASGSTAGQNDWVNPSDELLATLRQELDLDLRDAPDDSDGSGRAESGLAKKCRPWHWLQEMRWVCRKRHTCLPGCCMYVCIG